MADGFSRNTGATSREPAVIVGIDTQTRTATALLRSKYTVNVNCAYAVGDAIITPTTGEQWYIERFDMEWRLAARIPFNDETLNIEPEEGQVSVGSANGPLELNGTEIRANGLFRLGLTYFSISNTGKLQSSIDGETWTPVVPPAGPGAPASTDEVPEGAINKYYTNARASAAAPVQSVATRTGAVVLTKNDVGLSNVDNTTDALKPISSATASALALKADLVGGIVPNGQLPPPSVRPYANLASFPAPGTTGVLYLAEDTALLYRWNGSAFTLAGGTGGGGGISNTDALPEGTTNLYYTDTRASAAAPVQTTDPRLSDTRTPTDNTVTTAKIVDANVTLAKLAPDVAAALAASPYDISYPQTVGQRAIGYGQATIGVKMQRAVTFSKITYRCATADASGSSTFEIRRNGVAVPGTSQTIIAANQVVGTSVTGSFVFVVNDILTVYVTAVGTTPGLGLVADLMGEA